VTEHDDELYLVHIDETAALIERSAAARGKQALMSDEDLRDATIYRLQTLAESTQRLSSEFIGAHPEVPWDDIAGFRNRAVHGYRDVKLDIVWSIIERDLPELARCVRVELGLRRERAGPVQKRDTGLDIGF
jgi:uncharacterized protein with HEPN domain